VFAAGFGTRLAPLTQKTPKPLIKVAGRTMIDRALDLADDAGITRKIVNTHYLSAQIERHLAARRDVSIIVEKECILDTGGGLRNAVSQFSLDALFTLNPDAIWSGANPLGLLARGWEAGRMSGLLALIPLDLARGHNGRGDFSLDSAGRISRYDGRGTAYVYTSAQLIDTSGLSAINRDVFSLNLYWDRLIAQKRLFGLPYMGGWVDVGSPAGLDLAESLLSGARDV